MAKRTKADDLEAAIDAADKAVDLYQVANEVILTRRHLRQWLGAAITAYEPRPPTPVLKAIISALSAALAGEGFDGGDFNGQNRKHFEQALEWAQSKSK